MCNIYVTFGMWLIYVCDMTHFVFDTWHDPTYRVVTTRYVMTRYVTHLCVWYDSLYIHVTYVCNMYVTHGMWLIYVCDMTHFLFYMWHDPTYRARAITTRSVTHSLWLIYVCDMTHFVFYVTRPTHFLPATHSYQQTQGRTRPPKCPGNKLDHWHIFQNSQGPCIFIFLLFSIFYCSRRKGVSTKTPKCPGTMPKSLAHMPKFAGPLPPVFSFSFYFLVFHRADAGAFLDSEIPREYARFLAQIDHWHI